MLQQIIRCFPFPSPRNSPRPGHKKSIVRTISNDPAMLELNSQNNKADSQPTTPSFSASLTTNQSSWQLRKKQLGHLLHRVTSHEAPEGNATNLGTSSSTATLFTDSNKGEKQGALGKLCKVGFSISLNFMHFNINLYINLWIKSAFMC